MSIKIRIILEVILRARKHWPIVIFIVLGIITLAFSLMSMVVTILFGWMSWGEDEPVKLQPYVNLAAEHQLVWQELLAIDLAKHDMDQDDLKPKKLEKDFVYYVYVDRTVCSGSGEKQSCRTERVKEKRTRTFAEVMDYLNFTEEQRDNAQNSLSLLYEDSIGYVIGGDISIIGENQIPAKYIPIYKGAEAKYGVPWNLLASIHKIETTFSTDPTMISSVGAEGHMQFMPCTFIGWAHSSCSGAGKGNFTTEEKSSLDMIRKYGGYGVDANGDGKADMWDVNDAIYSAAHMLSKNGASDGDYEKAVRVYNKSSSYVAEVMKYMNLYVAGYDEVEEIGVNKEFIRPVSGAVTSKFGPRIHPITGEKGKLHAGVDLACSKGQAIPASKGGKVIFAGWQDASDPTKGYGQYIRIDHGGGSKTTYAHLSSIGVKVGDTVKQGAIIGGCGSTGGSTGNHLHFEIFVNNVQVDPSPFIGIKD
jgi:hypothetical protein